MERFSYLVEGGVSKSAMVTMTVFNNTQQNLWLTFQWGGSLPHFMKVTARSKGGLYHSAYTFQSRAVTLMWRNRPKNKVLCLPAAIDDERTKAGTGAIVKKFFRLSDLIIPANPADIMSRGETQRNDKVKWANPTEIDSHFKFYQKKI